MYRDHDFRIRAEWTDNRGTGTSGYREYDRLVTLSADGKPDLLGSSARAFHGDATRWNPEDLLVAALSECHLLSYLHACVEAGVVLTSYTDAAVGTMRPGPGKGGAFTEVVLRPQVTVTDAAMIEAATAAHRTAHQWCFIANSVNFPVRIEPAVTVRR